MHLDDQALVIYLGSQASRTHHLPLLIHCGIRYTMLWTYSTPQTRKKPIFTVPTPTPISNKQFPPKLPSQQMQRLEAIQDIPLPLPSLNTDVLYRIDPFRLGNNPAKMTQSFRMMSIMRLRTTSTSTTIRRDDTFFRTSTLDGYR